MTGAWWASRPRASHSLLARIGSLPANVWIQAALAAVLCVGGGSALFFTRIQPSIPAGGGDATEFAWDQIVAAALAVALTVIFGR